MTPRDYYAAAALANPTVWLGRDRDGRRVELGTSEAVRHALAAADMMAKEACTRWGHLGTFGSCGRCGVDLGQRPPPPPVRVP
jgi:hypothetical protein